MRKLKSMLLSILWTIIMLLFPVVSGVIATVREMEQPQIFLTQGSFMLTSIAIPAIYLRARKIRFRDIGFAKLENGSAKKSLYFLPLILAEIPLIIFGVDFVSARFALSLAFFAVAVGFAEEIYFRGVILRLLKNAFPLKRAIVISALVFGLGHFASILAAADIVAVLLQILNAVVFGVIAAEVTALTKSLWPVVLWHTAFNYVNHIVLASGTRYIIVVAIHEVVMIAYAAYLWRKTC